MVSEVSDGCCHGDGETTIEICLCFKAEHNVGLFVCFLRPRSEAVMSPFNNYLWSSATLSPSQWISQEMLDGNNKSRAG